MKRSIRYEDLFRTCEIERKADLILIALEGTEKYIVKKCRYKINRVLHNFVKDQTIIDKKEFERLKGIAKLPIILSDAYVYVENTDSDKSQINRELDQFTSFDELGESNDVENVAKAESIKKSENVGNRENVDNRELDQFTSFDELGESNDVENVAKAENVKKSKNVDNGEFDQLPSF